MVLNKNGKQSQKEAQKRLNERIEAKVNDKTPTTLKTLTFHAACDEWFEHYKLISGSKQSTITTKSYKVAHIKNTDKDILVENMNAKVIQDLINSSLKDGLSHKVVKDDLSIIKNILRYTQRNITSLIYHT